MLTAVAALLFAPFPAEGIGEYFPLNQGDAWHYMNESDYGTTRQVDTVGEPVELNGTKVVPVVTSMDGKEVDRAYYRVGEGEVAIVAFILDKPLLTPYPILKSPDIGGKWTHRGETFMEGALADLKLEGRVKRTKAEEFNGKSIEAIEVRLEATMLEQFGTKITVTQVATYGKGIGMIKMESTTKLPKKTQRETRRLVAYIPAKH